MTTHHRTEVIDVAALGLSDPEEMAIELVDVAGTTALVVDNVYKDPDYVRGLALSLHYHRRQGAYPGSFAFVSISSMPLLNLINTLLGDHVGDHLTFATGYEEDFVFAIITQRGADLSPDQGKPHVDGFCDYAGLVYLNPPEQVSGGTAFWRHTPTGLQMLSGSAEMAALRGQAQDSEPPAAPGYPTESTATWERTQVLPMKYNRLVVYNSYLIHSPYYHEDRFGDELSTRRLTQNLYLQKWETKRAQLLARRRA